MKYAIITPTFEPHFKFVKRYIESYNKFVVDKENITLLFTISKKEAKSFKKITDKCCDSVKFETLFFEDILQHFNINLTPDELLIKYKKFTFQTLKKFYTMLYSDADRFLVLDSESMWVKETNMKELFENFFNAPFITSSSITMRDSISNLTQGVNDNVNFLLRKHCDKWFIENFVWFYDKKILNELFKNYGSPIEMANKVYELKDKQRRASGIFEIELYQTYIYYNNDKYNYTLLDVETLLKNSLTPELLQKYLNTHKDYFEGNCGILEHTMRLLNKANVKSLAEMFKKYRFNIIRCNYTNFSNLKLQKKFMDIVQPNILAASQDHCWGYKFNFIQPQYTEKLKKHINSFLPPILKFIQWIFHFISILKYTLKILLSIIKNTILYCQKKFLLKITN